MEDPEKIKVLEVYTKNGEKLSEMEFFSVTDLIISSYNLFIEINKLFAYNKWLEDEKKPKQYSLFKKD